MDSANMTKGKVVLQRFEHSGIPVSPGIVIGRAFLVDKKKVKPHERFIEPSAVEEEASRFHRALEQSRDQLLSVKKHYEQNNIGDYGYLVDVSLLMLKDNMLVRETEQLIRAEFCAAEWAFWQVIQKIKEVFSNLDDEYFRDRQNDIDHLGERVLRNLVGLEIKRLQDVKIDVVVVAHDLSPMDTAQMDVHYVKAFVTDLGVRTSHTAILARALGIPAAVGLENITDTANGGDLIIVDGISGKVILNPTPEEVAHYNTRRERYQKYIEELDNQAENLAETADGRRVMVRGNVELEDELRLLSKYRADGIGLYRTEFMYLNHETLPTEEDHYRTYMKFAEAVYPEILTIRTLDLGGDKAAHSLPLSEEVNPALGLRSIRLCMKEREIFKEQLRGILRASVKGNLRVMFPMISGIHEIEETLKVVGEVKAELKARGEPFSDEMPMGVMIEIPSAAVMADKIAKMVDFMSIGTNDLIQYTIAIDRGNEHVAYLYEPLNPAVLRLIKMTADAGKKEGKLVSVCGEMAGDELYTVLLLGLGVDELSMQASMVPRIKRVIKKTTTGEAEELAGKLLQMSTAGEVEDFLRKYFKEKQPGLLDPLSEKL
ncbi:phosphoenolpyruvate--protein phosphotransferase [bacterium]|nr:MAG: phosphoenolpyruvate--protein phosphotransferase [bacterium]